jgi:energy-coupling factor transporter ATP-binding protein EcfA2
MHDHGVVTPRPTLDPAALHATDERVAADATEAGLVPLHAAAVETLGKIVALAGESGAGKSTLAAAAVLAGDRFVADEITAVSPDDRLVRPYHRPIGLRRGGADALGIDFPPDRRSIPGAVHPVTIDDPDRLSAGGILRLIAIVRWDPDSPPALAAIEPAQALAELSQHIVVTDDIIPAAFRGLEHIVRAVGLVRLTYRDPADGVRMLREAVAAWSR